MLSKLYKIYAIKCDPDDLAGSTILGGITNVRLGANVQIVQQVTSGMVYGQFQELLGGEPAFSFSSYHLGRMLDVCGLTGLRISAATLTGVTFYGYQKKFGGTRVSGANHVSFNVKNGIIFPRRIRIPFRGSAQIDYQGLITYDGVTLPFVMSESVSVPANTVDDQRYGLGIVQLGTITGDAITLTGHNDIEIDLGVQASADGSGSDVWPSFASIDKIIPSVRITTMDVDKLKSSGGVALTGKQLLAAKTTLIARKRASAGTTAFHESYADPTASVHCAFTPLAGCAFHEDILSGSFEGNATATLMMQFMSDDGSNPPLAVDTTAAYAAL